MAFGRRRSPFDYSEPLRPEDFMPSSVSTTPAKQPKTSSTSKIYPIEVSYQASKLDVVVLLGNKIAYIFDQNNNELFFFKVTINVSSKHPSFPSMQMEQSFYSVFDNKQAYIKWVNQHYANIQTTASALNPPAKVSQLVELPVLDGGRVSIPVSNLPVLKTFVQTNDDIVASNRFMPAFWRNGKTRF